MHHAPQFLFIGNRDLSKGSAGAGRYGRKQREQIIENRFTVSGRIKLRIGNQTNRRIVVKAKVDQKRAFKPLDGMTVMGTNAKLQREHVLRAICW